MSKPIATNRKRGVKGFALLEYCAGAAIIAGVIWVALANFGESLSGLLGKLSSWAQVRSTEIQTAAGGSAAGGTSGAGN